MSIIKKMNSPKFKQTKSDIRIRDYVIANIDEIPYMQISTMAKKIGIGEATITRYVKKLGCSGFQDFKLCITKENTIREEQNILDISIKQNEPVFDTANKLYTSQVNVLKNTLNNLNIDKIGEIADLILNSRKVYFIGIGFSGITALDSSLKFMRIGIDSTYYDNHHLMLMMASIIKEEDVIICISNSGETKEVIDTIKLAKQNNAKIISIVGDSTSKIAQISDIFLRYSAEERILETGSIYTKIAQLFVIELIYAQVVKQNLEESTNIKIKTTNAITKI